MISRRSRTMLSAVVVVAAVAGSCTDVAAPIIISPPSNVTVTLVTPTSVRVTWAAPPESDAVLSYNVIRNGTKIGEPTSNSYVDNGLVEGTTYRYQVSANGISGEVSDLSSESPAATITVPDVTAPTILASSPAGGASAVTRAASITVTFSETIDPATVNTATFIVKGPGGATLPGTVTYNSATRVAEFRADGALPNSAGIAVTLTTGVKDPGGNRLASDFTFSFSTRDEVPPVVTSTSPANASSGVPVAAAITVTFDEPIDPTTVTAASFVVTATSGGANVAGTISFDAPSRTATFAPNVGLGSATGYTVTVGTAVKDVAGNAMAATYSFSFTTGDASAPSVLSASPPNGLTAVSLGATVSVVFSEPMDPSTINGATIGLRNTSTGTPVSGAISYIGAGNSATFTPSAPLSHSTSYTIFVTAGAKDVAGNALSVEFSSEFSTAAPADLTPPSVVSTVPASGAANVSVGAAIAAGFSEAMEAASINAATFTMSVASSGAPVSGVVSYDGATNTAVFTLAAPLAFGTAYTATIATGAKDVAGNPLSVAFSWSFATAAAPDVLAPTVLGTAPADGTVGVSVNAALTVTFSEAMDPSTINAGTIRVTNATTSAAVIGVVSYNSAGNSATFTPNSPLAFATGYNITVTTGAKDAAGNSLATVFTALFATASAPDTSPPTVLAVAPSNGATSVSVGSAVTVTFSEPMNPATINSSTLTLKVTSSSSPVVGSISYDAGTNTVRFTPSSPLAYSTGYTVTVTTGAKDLAGNALPSTFTAVFTTGAAPDITPPTVSSTLPANGATDVPINSVVSVTFSEAMAAGTITASNIKLRITATSAEVAGAVSYNSGTNTATFTPTSALSNSTGYTIVVSSEVRDQAGNQLAGAFSASFTTVTAADNTAPTVISTSPANGATMVSPGTAVKVTFSEAMDPTSIDGSTFRLVATASSAVVAGVVSYDAGTAVATFSPSAPLDFDTDYTATVTTGIKDVAGNGLAANVSITFRVTYVQTVTGYWSGTTADGSLHVHLTLDEPYPNPSLNFALRPNNCGGQPADCRVYPLTVQGQGYLQSQNPADVTAASGSFPQPQMSMTFTSNGIVFTLTATISNRSSKMTGTISGGSLPPTTLLMDRIGP